jgi:hypothetical protein
LEIIFNTNNLEELISNINEVANTVSFIDYEFGKSEDECINKIKIFKVRC